MGSRNNYVYDVNDPSYKPNALLNHLTERLNAKNDAHLAIKLNVPKQALSRIRTRACLISPYVLLCIMDATDIGLPELRAIVGLPARKETW